MFLGSTDDLPLKLGGFNSLGEGAEGVAERLGCQMEKSLQEDVDLQGVEALALV